jgi:hypothetical protein
VKCRLIMAPAFRQGRAWVFLGTTARREPRLTRKDGTDER